MADWMFESIYQDKNKLYMITKRHPTSRNEISSKTYKTKLHILLKRAESEYYSKQIQINKHNMKKTWDII